MSNLGMSWKIRVRFSSKSMAREFVTNDIRREDPRWGDEIFHSGIESLEFFIPSGHRLVLAGMERYNFFVEASAPWGGGRPKIEAFWFLGKPPGKDTLVECVCVREGRIERTQHPFGSEWGGGPTRGWKQGTVGNKIVCAIVPGH